MRRQYRISWNFPSRPPLVRLAYFNSDDSANRAARAPEFYWGIFRRAGLYDRSTSEFEYLDRFPTPSSVTVKPTGE